MKDEEMWLGVGVLVLLGLHGSGGAVDWGPASAWAWPVPDLVEGAVTFPATVSNAFNADKHRGVDVLYGPGMPAQGKQGWFAPENTPILAARAGKVFSVSKTARGWQMVIDHGKPWATYYQHMSSIRKGMDKGRLVVAGEQIGVMGSDPTDAQHVRHLHFETWYNGAAANAVDPERVMAAWKHTTWNGS